MNLLSIIVRTTQGSSVGTLFSAKTVAENEWGRFRAHRPAGPDDSRIPAENKGEKSSTSGFC